ncbi:hypothetical protein [Cystobacter fuscus]|uniref:hypothetical protein n=1 Tax=Cystobacter fuscus TaxID=43 RepID=UPI002B2A0100|nr:hypothetical protein F0U63_16735 [Cystobacter fuscus]
MKSTRMGDISVHGIEQEQEGKPLTQALPQHPARDRFGKPDSGSPQGQDSALGFTWSASLGMPGTPVAWMHSHGSVRERQGQGSRGLRGPSTRSEHGSVGH